MVLLHGLGNSARSYDRLAPLLERGGRTLVRVDRPGAPSFSIAAQAADALGAFEGVGDVVVGHSMGGHVAVAMAEQAPGRVRRLVLVDTAPTAASRLTASRGIERVVRTPAIGPLMWRLAPRRRLRDGLRTAFAPGHDVPDVFVEDLASTSWAAFVRSTAAIDAYVAERPVPDRLAAIDPAVAVDVVFGEQDLRVDGDSVRRYEGVPRVRVTRLSGVGHSPIWERPEAVAAVVDSAA